MKRSYVENTNKRIRLHGKLLQAIANMREAKNEKDTIGESAIGFIEVSKTVNDVYEMVENMEGSNSELKEKVNNIESKLLEMSTKMDTLYNVMVNK
jgi:predicted nuclease with TOPRIM domain